MLPGREFMLLGREFMLSSCMISIQVCILYPPGITSASLRFGSGFYEQKRAFMSSETAMSEE